MAVLSCFSQARLHNNTFHFENHSPLYCWNYNNYILTNFATFHVTHEIFWWFPFKARDFLSRDGLLCKQLVGICVWVNNLFVFFVFIKLLCGNSLSTEAEECGSTRRSHMNFESKSNLGWLFLSVSPSSSCQKHIADWLRYCRDRSSHGFCRGSSSSSFKRAGKWTASFGIALILFLGRLSNFWTQNT